MSANHTTKHYTFSQKWGDDPFTALGHTQVPDALIGHAARLGLAPEECWLIVCILKFKHTPDNPYPSQERLAGIIGQSEDTVRRLLKRIQNKGLVHVDRVRGDLGHYTHSVYDFTPLRAALNEAFYQDHPEERPPQAPPGEAPAATVQNCTVVDTTPQKVPQPPRKIGRNHPAKSAPTTMQNCGPKKSLQKEEKKDQEQTLNVGPRALKQAATAGTQAAGRTSNGGEGLNLSSSEPGHQPGPGPGADQAQQGDAQAGEQADNNPGRPRDMTAEDLDRSVARVVAALGDRGSERRHRQLLSVCDRHGLRSLAEKALFATQERLARQRRLGALENPGAYYQAVLITLLADHQVFVPKAAEAAETRAEMRAALGLAGDATPEQIRAALRDSLPSLPSLP